ncbi:hypothetical protein D3C75_1318770 [compost metagenome]
MLVVVMVGDIDLTNAVGGGVPVDFRQYANLQSPIAGNPQVIEDMGAHGELTGERIAVAAQIVEKIRVAIDLLQ